MSHALHDMLLACDGSSSSHMWTLFAGEQQQQRTLRSPNSNHMEGGNSQDLISERLMSVLPVGDRQHQGQEPTTAC